jgi:hypothetical protein
MTSTEGGNFPPCEVALLARLLPTVLLSPSFLSFLHALPNSPLTIPVKILRRRSSMDPPGGPESSRSSPRS